MSELEDKLNHLLDDPDAMGRIMQMAQQLSGTLSTPKQAPAASDIGELGFDVQTLTKLLPLINEFKTNNTQASQLLYALRPYLKEEKQSKVERAVRLAHLIHVGKKAMTEWGLDLV